MPLKIDWEKVDKGILWVEMGSTGSICGVGKHGPMCWMGNDRLPHSALLEPYHPRDWKTSRVERPVVFTPAQYEAMAERRQFGEFRGRVEDIPQYGHLQSFSEDGPYHFRREESGSPFVHFRPFNLVPLTPEEVES